MKLIQLMEKLHSQNILWIHRAAPEAEIYQCRLLKAGLLLNPTTLYLCTPEQITQKMDVSGHHFLCLNRNPNFKDCCQFQNADLAELHESLEPEELEAKINEILNRHIMLTQNMYQIIQILHSNLGLQALVDASYDILGNPLLVVDTSYKILASCQNAIYGRPDLDAQRELGYLLESNISAMKQAHLYEKARAANYPYYAKEKESSEGWITALVYIHGIETAHIAAADSNHPFSEEDYEFIDFLCRIVSLELQKNDFYKTNKSMMHSFFLSELLDNHMRDMETIHRRAQSLNWIRTDYLRIMTVSDKNSVIFDQKAQLISRQMTMLFPVCHWVIYEGYIVFLIGTADPSTEEFRQNGRLITFLESNHLTASFSRCFHSLIDTRRFYDESLAAYQLGQRFHPEDTLHFYTDYICQHIGGILAEHSALANFYHPAVEKIRAYDAEHNSNLLETLKEYLTYPDNPGLAAEHLYIHKNTLFYRMSKIRELFGLNLSNGEERLILHLSLKFMELEN